MSAALDVLAQEGLDRLTFVGLAERTRAGKAGIYRRWSSVAALVDQALSGVQVVAGAPADRGSLRADLFAVMEPWMQPLTREHRAAAALFSAAHTDPVLRELLTRQVVQPLRTVVATVFARSRVSSPEGDPGVDVPEARVQMVTVLLQSMWWEMGLAWAEPLSAGDLWTIIDDGLLAPSSSAGLKGTG